MSSDMFHVWLIRDDLKQHNKDEGLKYSKYYYRQLKTRMFSSMKEFFAIRLFGCFCTKRTVYMRIVLGEGK